MPYVLNHCASMFAERGADRHESESTILEWLGITSQRNLKYLDRHPETPKLYDANIVYALPDQITHQPDPAKLAKLGGILRDWFSSDDETIDIIQHVLSGIEIFRDIPAIIAKKAVDCDNLACWRVAELWRAGVKASPRIQWRETSEGTTYHALVQWPDGSSEDPSILLGMQEREPGHRREEQRKNQERYDTMLETARQLLHAGQGSPAEMGHQIDALGLVPKVGWGA